MNSCIVSDWKCVDIKTREGTRALMGALNHFMRQPDESKKVREAMQHFATRGDFPAEIMPVVEKFRKAPFYDGAYEEIFDIRSMSNVMGFDLADVSSGLTFEVVPTGAKARVCSFSGEKARVSFSMWGAAFNWDNTLIDDAQYVDLEDLLYMFRHKAYEARARAHYALINAIPTSQNLAWQPPTPPALPSDDARYVALRDVNTINKACENILLALKDRGFGITDASRFILLAPLQRMDRINQALGYSDLMQGAMKHLNYAVTPRFTTMLSSSNSYYICLPKGKAKGGNRMSLTLLSQQDILAYATTLAAWMSFGACIGEVKQFQRCALA